MSLLAVLLAFPCVVFSVILAVALVYWLFVVIGALDIDWLDSAAGIGKGGVEGATGAAKGAIEGAAGAAKGAFEGVAGAAKGALSADIELGDVDGPDAGFLGFLKLRNAPMTIVISLFALFGWLMTGAYSLTFGVPSLAFGIPIFLGASVLSLVLTSFAVRPLAPLFNTRQATKNNDLVGKVAVVSTGDVTERYGQATLEDGGAGLILQVRSDERDALKRGDRVLLIEWDAAKGAFLVERMPGESQRSARLAHDLSGKSFGQPFDVTADENQEDQSPRARDRA